MRALVQRVTEADVSVGGSTIGSIRKGLLILIGISRDDTTLDADYVLGKVLGLRIFPDSEGKMNQDINQAGGSLLLVSQFTLYGDCRKGRRPNFDGAAPPEKALVLYNYFVDAARQCQVPVETGVFQAHMQVHLINDGPVTLWIESDRRADQS